MDQCAIDWELKYDNEMALLCEEIAGEFRCKMWDEEEKRVEFEFEQDRITDGLGSVGLECAVDGLLNSFQTTTL